MEIPTKEKIRGVVYAYSPLERWDLVRELGTDWIRQILADDLETLKDSYKKDAGSVRDYIRQQTGTVFSHVLENAGVYKQTPEGLAGFKRFISTIGYIR